MIYLLLKNLLCGHSTEGLKVRLCQDILPMKLFQVFVHETCTGY